MSGLYITKGKDEAKVHHLNKRMSMARQVSC